MKVLFSVIIPALNEEKLLPRLLDELKAQTEQHFEVILVDANSSDKTVAIAQSYEKHFPLRIVHIPDKNISKSRNTGASVARGDYFFFIDADNYIYPAFLTKMKKHIEKGYELIIPAVLPDSRKIFYKILYSFVNILITLANKFYLSFSTGGNFVITKEAFKKLGGFDETIFVGEDHDIVAKAQRTGLKIVFVTQPKVIFSVRRFEKEGFAVFIKYFISTVYIALFGKITKKIYNYQMGGDYYSPHKKK